MLEPLCPPDEPRLCEDDCEPPGLGMEEPARPPPPEDGMLGEPPPPDEPPDGIEDDCPPEEDDCCCCCGQPPIRNAQTAPTAVAWTATTGSDLRER
jgi:hypothetical protein